MLSYRHWFKTMSSKSATISSIWTCSCASTATSSYSTQGVHFRFKLWLRDSFCHFLAFQPFTTTISSCKRFLKNWKAMAGTFYGLRGTPCSKPFYDDGKVCESLSFNLYIQFARSRLFWLVVHLIVVGWYHTIVVAAPAFPRAVDDQRGIAPGNEHWIHSSQQYNPVHNEDTRNLLIPPKITIANPRSLPCSKMREKMIEMPKHRKNRPPINSSAATTVVLTGGYWRIRGRRILGS